MQRMVRAFQQELGVYRSVMTDQRCPRLARWLLGGAVVYALSPIDLIPDFIPVLGHIDDVLVLAVLLWLAVRLIPKEVITEHRPRRESIRSVQPVPAPFARGCAREGLAGAFGHSGGTQ